MVGMVGMVGMGAPGRVQLDEAAIVAILMFFGMAGSIPGIAPNQANEMTGAAATGLQTAVGIASQVLVNGLIVLLLFSGRHALLRYARLTLPALSLPLFALCSVLWSQDPLLTARRSVPFLLAAAFGIYTACRMEPKRFLALLQIVFLLLAAWSAVLALGFPKIGLDASTGHGGDWQGVFTQKNACGRAMVFALTSVVASGRLTRTRAFLLVVFTAELALSGSRGAWLLGVVSVAAMLLFRDGCRLDRDARVVLLFYVVFIAAASAVLGTVEFANLAPLLGRDATLTGRTAIWHEVWIAIQRQPVLGYGFSAFWQGAQGPSWSVVAALRFVLFHAHNGFLEVWLELGFLGLLLLSVGFLRASVLLVPEILSGNFEAAAWPFAVLLLVLLYDFDENTLISFNGLFFVLYAAVLARVELLAFDRARVRRLLAGRERVFVSPWLPDRRVYGQPETALPLAHAAPAKFSLPTAGPHVLPGFQRSPWL